MNIVSVSNPIYSKSDNSTIDCMVTFDNGQTHPYTAAAYDDTDYGRALWSALIAGSYGAIGAYIAPTLSAAQKAANAIASGIVLTSTGTPALNGTYPCDAMAQAKVNGVVTCIVVNGTFPNAASTMNWYDTSGAAHVFPDVTHFKNFANAFINFVALVTEYADSNGAAGSIPSNAITIA